MSQIPTQADELSVDVLVIGAGFAGLAAALEARQRGATVTVLSRTGLLANNSAMSGGQVVMVGTPLQKEMGIKDSPELLAQDILSANNNSVDAELVRTLAHGATDLYKWLTGLGCIFCKVTPGSAYTHSVPRSHTEIGERSASLGRGSRMVKLLHGAAREWGIDVRLGTYATRLITDDGGRVRGASVEDKLGHKFNIEARHGVVLAAGGFAKNKGMLQEYAPKLVCWPSITAGGSTGDGIKMGMEAGANAVNMDTTVMIYGVLSKNGRYMAAREHMPREHIPTSFRLALAEGIAVNKEGRRFMDEGTSYARGTARVMKQKDPTFYVVFDEQTKNRPELAGCTELFTGRNAEELASELSIDPQRLSETIDSCNGAAATGTQFTRDGGAPFQGRTLRGRLFAVPATAVVMMTYGGLRTNTSAQALNRNGLPIPGLYVAGDNAPGLGGPSSGYNATPGYLPGTGNLTALCFGRIAGKSAANG